MNPIYVYSSLKYSSSFSSEPLKFTVFLPQSSSNDCTNLCKELQSRIQIVERQQISTSNANTPVCFDSFQFFFFKFVLCRQRVVIQVHHLMSLHSMIHRQKNVSPLVHANDLIQKAIPMPRKLPMISPRNPSRSDHIFVRNPLFFLLE